MTVKELIAELQKHDPDALVVMSCDAEGNGFSPCCDADARLYAADTTYSGEVYPLQSEIDADDDLDADDYAPPPDAVHAVVLWPVN